MRRADNTTRNFLFLQGPHGPYFARLADMLRRTGAGVWRVGFNSGDRIFWPDRSSYIPYRGTLDDWPDRIVRILCERQITDLVLYGDTRPVHSRAVEAARAAGITVHVFEEGYLRPYWVTYERGGANGNSRLMQMSVSEMRAALERCEMELPDAPARWGDMRHHIFYGALYHAFVLLANRRYRHFRPHRALGVGGEFRLYLRRLLLMPFRPWNGGGHPAGPPGRLSLPSGADAARARFQLSDAQPVLDHDRNS
jgi:capsular polysaccharide export protein